MRHIFLLKCTALAISALFSHGAYSQIQLPEPFRQCCPGRNLLANGTFENGNTGFTSNYIYQAPGMGAGTVGTGEYSVMTSTEALAASATWIAGCADYGKQLIVNAATERPGTASKLAYAQTVNLRPGSYRFCGDFRNLRQCAFNASSRVTVEILSAQSLTPLVTNSFSLTGSSCAWIAREWDFTVGSFISSDITINVYLSETMNGDGNDVALDNFGVYGIGQVPTADVQFNVTFTPVAGTNYNNASAAPVTALGAGCTQFWMVEEIDANDNPVLNTTVTNPASWANANPNTYIGYTGSNVLSGTAAGKFAIARRWRFVYGRECPCQTLRMVEHLYGPTAGRGTEPTLTLLSSGEYNGPDDGTANLRQALSGNEAIKVFPNPTDDEVTLQMPALQTDATLRVLSVAGQELKNVRLQASEVQARISLRDFPAGVYLLQLVTRTGEMILNQKISKL